MSSSCDSIKDPLVEIFGINVWSCKGVQKVLNHIAENIDIISFDEIIGSLKDILKYPGIWDSGNILKFIDIFNRVVSMYVGDSDNRIDLRNVWERFDYVRIEQEMESTTLFFETEITKLISDNGNYASAQLGRVSRNAKKVRQ